MEQLSNLEIRRAAKLGKPVDFMGLSVYPLTVEDYAMFCACESVLTLRLSKLPAIYAMQNFAQAIYSREYDSALNGEKKGDWSKFLVLIAMSLHINGKQFSQQIKHSVDAEDQRNLKALIITQYTDDNEIVVRLETSHLSKLREVIAELNGRHLPDEADNIELVEAEEEMLASSKLELEFDLDDMFAAVAANQHIRISELDSWTIYEFELIRRAIDRAEKYRMAGNGEFGGMVKFNNGNPYPSMFFDRKKESLALINADAFIKRVEGAVQQTDSLPIF